MAARLQTIGAASLAPWIEMAKSRWIWCALVAVFVTVRTLADPTFSLRTNLGDSDDATRLLFVRDLLAGGSWFDMVTSRLGGPSPLHAHWSRLVDLPIALLVSAFSLVASPATAELAARIAWPTLVLALFLRLLVNDYEARAAAGTTWLLLALAATCAGGLFQFLPGRIDHHNVMILGTVGGLLLLSRAMSPDAELSPRQAWFAGGLLGFALAVGYEPLALIALSLALAGLAALMVPGARNGLKHAAAALALTLVLAFVATVAPSNYGRVVCDALSLNMVLLAAGGAIGAWALDRVGRDASLLRAAGALCLPAAAGAIGYAVVEPVCLAGPFAQVDAKAMELWFVGVQEVFSMVKMLPLNPVLITVVAVVLVIGAGAAWVSWRRTGSWDDGALLALMATSLPLAMWQVKLVPYAVWLATIVTAAAISRLAGSKDVSALSARLGAILALNQSTLALLVGAILSIGGASAEVRNGSALETTKSCRSTPVIATLASLPKGLIVAPIDLGPYIAVLTPHDALSAPYHRIDKSILAAQQILDGDIDKAQGRLKSLAATYVVLCASEGAQADRKAGRSSPVTLESRLLAGEQVGFLEPLSGIDKSDSLKVWRVR